MKAKIYVGLSLDRSQSTQSSGNRGRGARDEKSSKMSVQLKDTQPSIWNPERNTTHASVVARDLGRARRLIERRTARGEGLMRIRVRVERRRMKYDAMKCTSETGQRRVLINPTLVYIWHNQIYASKPRDAANGHRPADASGSRRETEKNKSRRNRTHLSPLRDY